MARAHLMPAILILLLGSAKQAGADTISTFNLAWSGAAYGNTAVATGQITLDLSLLPNPDPIEDILFFSAPLVQAFSITVAGASSGNGTFPESDFGLDGFFFAWGTAGGTLDFSQQLVGQTTGGDPWASDAGVSGNSGDFNVSSNGTDPTAPFGTYYFQLTTDDGAGDPMNLTSFAPAEVPLPTSTAMALALLPGLGIMQLARRRLAAV
jgi:hypothetical protein